MDIRQLISEYREKSPQWLFGSAVLPASGPGQIQLSVPVGFYFQSQYLAGSYTTINGGVDVGVCGVSLQIEDKGKHLRLTDALIPLSLFCSPGRQRTSGVAGDPSHQLFMPIEFNHLFRPVSTIQIDLQNAFTSPNTVNIVIMGIAWYVDPSLKFE